MHEFAFIKHEQRNQFKSISFFYPFFFCKMFLSYKNKINMIKECVHWLKITGSASRNVCYELSHEKLEFSVCHLSFVRFLKFGIKEIHISRGSALTTLIWCTANHFLQFEFCYPNGRQMCFPCRYNLNNKRENSAHIQLIYQLIIIIIEPMFQVSEQCIL